MGGAAGSIRGDADLVDVLGAGDVEFLVNLVLDGKTVAIPAESSGDVVAGLGGVTGDDILDGTGEDMAVVGKTGGEWGTIVEGVLGLALGELQGGLEGLDLLPVL